MCTFIIVWSEDNNYSTLAFVDYNLSTFPIMNKTHNNNLVISSEDAENIKRW